MRQLHPARVAVGHKKFGAGRDQLMIGTVQHIVN
jgi:hypothetical protein